jgi:hypothetical protein
LHLGRRPGEAVMLDIEPSGPFLIIAGDDVS